jgi:hypothetical protein
MHEEVIPVGDTQLKGVAYPSLGNMFAVRLPKDELVPFYNDNWNFMTSTGTSSLLKTLSIPEAYFRRLTAATKKACLAEASADLRYDLMLLTKDTKVQYAAPALYDDSIYRQDPFDYLGLSSLADHVNVKVNQLDCINGFSRIVVTPHSKALVKNEYIPSVQLRVPVFYAREFILSYGLYKVVCSNGLLDAVSQSELKLSFISDPHSFGFSDMLQNMVLSIEKQSAKYAELFNHLRSMYASVSTVRTMLDAGTLKTALPGVPLNSLKKHVSLIYANAEVPPASPSSINSMYDVMDALTYYTARLGENSEKIRKAERSIFQYFAALSSYAMNNQATEEAVTADFKVL